MVHTGFNSFKGEIGAINNPQGRSGPCGYSWGLHSLGQR